MKEGYYIQEIGYVYDDKFPSNTFSHEYLKEIASDWDAYCDFFGGRNLESQAEFEEGDIEERAEYLIRSFGE